MKHKAEYKTLIKEDSMSDIEIYSEGLICMSVCAKEHMTPEAVAARVNARSPSGTSAGWCATGDDFADGSPNPSPCDQYADRKHHLLKC